MNPEVRHHALLSLKRPPLDHIPPGALVLVHLMHKHPRYLWGILVSSDEHVVCVYGFGANETLDEFQTQQEHEAFVTTFLVPWGEVRMVQGDNPSRVSKPLYAAFVKASSQEVWFKRHMREILAVQGDEQEGSDEGSDGSGASQEEEEHPTAVERELLDRIRSSLEGGGGEEEEGEEGEEEPEEEAPQPPAPKRRRKRRTY
jgi:hypothetical protein